MRLIGEIENEINAQRFASHLLTQGIATKVEPEGDSFEIWVKDEDELDRATAELEKFLADPESNIYQTAIEKAKELERETEAKRRRIEKNIVHVAKKGGSSKSQPLTILLIVICAVVALFTNFGSSANIESAMMRAMVFVSIDAKTSSDIVANEFDADDWQLELFNIKAFQVWRLITPIFIHFGPVHLIFNMIWLYQLGQLIENRYGTAYFAFLVLFCAITSNLAQQLAPSEWSGSGIQFVGQYLMSLSGGMSGVVYGLFGFVWLKSSLDPTAGFRINPSAVFILIGWLFFCMTPMAEAWFGLHVGNWAHGVGLLAGLAFGYWSMLMRK